MAVFALHEFIGGAIDRLVMKSSPSGGYTTKRITFYPDETYEVKDETLIKYLKGEIGDVRQKSVLTPELKATLAEYGVDYEIKKCGTCVNAKPKAYYNPFKLIEE